MAVNDRPDFYGGEGGIITNAICCWDAFFRYRNLLHPKDLF